MPSDETAPECIVRETVDPYPHAAGSALEQRPARTVESSWRATDRKGASLDEQALSRALVLQRLARLPHDGVAFEGKDLASTLPTASHAHHHQAPGLATGAGPF